MKCPFCHSEELKVTDSRNVLESNAIRRRRECQSCTRRFTTFETIELNIQVQKRNGTFEDFRQKKLISGLEAACRHTRICKEQVRELAYKITQEVMEIQLKKIKTEHIGDIVIKYLMEMDTVAYIRFACVYRRFKELNELKEAIKFLDSEEDHLQQMVSEKSMT
jgi:transcriptional repressor NrdR